jgi:ABC-type sugar transport system ATPase subunit
MSDELATEHLRAKSAAAAYNRDMTDRATAEQDARIAQEEAKVKALYPDFDMAEAMKSSRFKAMMDSGMTMQEAYEAMNYRRLTEQAVEKAVREAEDRLSKAPATNRPNRPAEGASVGGGAAGSTGIDFSRMTDAELERWLDENNH